jgi:hypothetical protein
VTVLGGAIERKGVFCALYNVREARTILGVLSATLSLRLFQGLSVIRPESSASETFCANKIIGQRGRRGMTVRYYPAATAVSCTLSWLLSGWECRGRRLSTW